jgi:hypothetical protein
LVGGRGFPERTSGKTVSRMASRSFKGVGGPGTTLQSPAGPPTPLGWRPGTTLQTAAGRQPKKAPPQHARHSQSGHETASHRQRAFGCVGSGQSPPLLKTCHLRQVNSTSACPVNFWCGGVVVVSVVRPSVQACRCLAGRQAWFTPDRLCRVVWSAAGKQLPARLAVVVVCRGGGPGPRSWLVRSARTGWLFTTTSRCINLKVGV